MPTERNPPEAWPPQSAGPPGPPGPDHGTEGVLREHYRPPATATGAGAGAPAEPDQFRARLQAVAERFGLPLTQLPGHLLVPQFDAVLIGDRSADLPAMVALREQLQANIRLDDGTAPRVLLNEPLAGRSATFLDWLNEADRRSTFVFIYVTNSFLGNAERLRYIEELYNESVSGPPDRRHRIVPIFAPDVDLNSQELSIPEAALFRNLRGLPLGVDQAIRPTELSDLRQLLRSRLSQRRQRENEQVADVENWAARATRREGDLLLQRMSDFFVGRMGRSSEEVKRQLAYFFGLLQQVGEPAPSAADAASHSMLLQEVGSQQSPDSGLATMASRQVSQLDSSSAASQLPVQQPPSSAQHQQQQPSHPHGAAAAAIQQQQQPPQQQQQQLAGVLRGVENLHVGSSQQVAVRGDTVHVHVTYVQQFVAGATQAQQQVGSGGDSGEQPMEPPGTEGGAGLP